jgi:hypothetical protein
MRQRKSAEQQRAHDAAYHRARAATPVGKFKAHRKSAIERGIEFSLTFEQWMEIWQASGHFHERGCKRGQYCMARYGDAGAYSVGNVRIITIEANSAEREFSAGTRAKLSATTSAYWSRKAAEARP